jgi:hypothetical protein
MWISWIGIVGIFVVDTLLFVQYERFREIMAEQLAVALITFLGVNYFLGTWWSAATAVARPSSGVRRS